MVTLYFHCNFYAVCKEASHVYLCGHPDQKAVISFLPSVSFLQVAYELNQS